MIYAEETFEGTWPYAPRFFAGNGFKMHYVDEGEGQPIVCVHGEPTWGYLYRNFVPRLTRQGRVIVPDNMGFGKSETPQDRDYSTREHGENLTRLLLELDLKDVTFVVQDWGGPISADFAYRHPERLKRYCVMNTGIGGRAPAGAKTPIDYPWFNWTLTDAFEPTLSNLSATALAVMKRIGFERTSHVDETWVRAYSAAFPTPQDCKGAIQFPRNIAAPETAEYLNELRALPGALDAVSSKAAMCIYGEEDRAVPLDMVVGGFRDLYPDAPVVTLPGVGHFLQEDAPEAVTAMIEQFIQMT
jgi:pimeloyl-ACP methyl ester carboxylesterase